MSKSTTIFIIVAFGLLATCFGGGYYLWRTYAGPMVAETKIAMDEATAFAPTTDNSGCVTESGLRYKSENEVIGGMKSMMFLSVCLKGSKPTPGFCDGVPAPRDMAKTQPWQKEQCGKVDATNMRCPMVLGAIQQHCHPNTA